MRKVSIFYVLMLMIGIMASCRTRQQSLKNEIFPGVDRLKTSDVRKFERKKSAKDITPKHLISLGESIYPNKNKYPLATPLRFRRPQTKRFNLETDYYYVTSDSSVKVILYEWSDPSSSRNSTSRSQEDTAQKLQRYQTKFDDIKAYLVKLWGAPVAVNTEQGKVPHKETFRDDSKWQSASGMHAYLFMLGNDQSGYRKIRLAVYKE